MEDPSKPNSQSQKLFSCQLQSILSQITKQFLTFEQLYLIFYESNIKFINSDSEAQIKQIFREHNNTMSLRECLTIIQLRKCTISHNRPHFYVGVKRIGHDPLQCFQDWKTLMRRKFGNQMRWFQNIAGIGQARRIKSFVFKSRLNIIMKGDPHQNCCETISQKFPKNTKNEIQWSTFMAVIRYNENKYNKPSLSPPQSPIQKNSCQKKYSQTPQNYLIYRPKISHHRHLQSEKMRRNKMNTQSSSKHQQHKTAHNFYNQSLNSLEKERQNIGQFRLKSSVEISRQFQLATQKFRSGASQRIQRIKSAKIGSNCKDISKMDCAMAIKDMNSIRYENSNRLNTSIEIQPQSKRQHNRKPSCKQDKQSSEYRRFGKYSIKVKVKSTTEPVFIQDNF